jgi:hypothetical protein
MVRAQCLPSLVAALVAGGAVAADQSLPFAELQRGRGDTAALGDLAHGEPGFMPVERSRLHGLPSSPRELALDFNIS